MSLSHSAMRTYTFFFFSSVESIVCDWAFVRWIENQCIYVMIVLFGACDSFISLFLTRPVWPGSKATNRFQCYQICDTKIQIQNVPKNIKKIGGALLVGLDGVIHYFLISYDIKARTIVIYIFCYNLSTFIHHTKIQDPQFPLVKIFCSSVDRVELKVMYVVLSRCYLIFTTTKY